MVNHIIFPVEHCYFSYIHLYSAHRFRVVNLRSSRRTSAKNHVLPYRYPQSFILRGLGGMGQNLTQKKNSDLVLPVLIVPKSIAKICSVMMRPYCTF